MVPNANARHFMLKARQRDLIAAAGGVERASAICNYGKSTVGRWHHADSTEIMPLDAIFALEEETGRFDMSEAIAASRGRRFADADVAAEAANASVMERHAAVTVKVGELMTVAALAFADGKLTPAEMREIDKTTAGVQVELTELRSAIAGAGRDGSISLIKGGAA